ncbi:DUF6-domain-containing protein [Xylariomycetidae sp. FL2044]|nr:DUF6-domain-containing protein [Xylariomycetidae sp. FL2044]
MGYGSTDEPPVAGLDQNIDASASSSPSSSSPAWAADVGHEADTAQDTSSSRRRAVWWSLKAFYERNIGLVFVFVAQTFGSVMSTAAKLLTAPDSAPPRLHALQIIFVRMLVTSVLGSLYMWYKRVPDFPLGPRGLRGILVLRGTAGFIGLFGLYYSLSYLEISDATAITFLIPTLTAFVCFVWLGEPYTAREALAGLIALAGIFLIARPAFLFGHKVVDPISGDPLEKVTVSMLDGVDFLNASSSNPDASVPALAAQRAVAIACAIMGTLGAATAYATIRVVGKRVHSLIAVNYFAVLATVGSAVIILAHPDLDFILPRGATQWVLLTIIGVAGFLLQFLLTEGLQREKGGRATNLTYLQMVFILIIERVIWGTTPPIMSFAGSALIIGAAIWLSLQRNKPSAAAQNKTPVVDEESSLLGGGGRP